MNCLVKNRFVTVLLLVIILAACAHAHPNGGDDSFDNTMDWPLDLFGNVGEQFADALAYNQYNLQMVRARRHVDARKSTYPYDKTSPPRPANSLSVTSPPRPSHPHLEPQPQHVQAIEDGSDYFSFAEMGIDQAMQTPHPASDTRSAPILAFAQDQHPAMSNFNNVGMISWMNDEVRVPQINHNAQTTMAYEAPVSAPANAANMYGYPHAPQARAHHTWPTQSQPSPPVSQHGLQEYNQVQFDVAGQLSLPLVDDQINRHASPNVNNVPHILPTEVTSNPNYQPGVVPSAPGNMLGWINRAPAIGERTLPGRLDTDMLAPPEVSSTNRSPTSASTTGSSARGSSRRQKWQMTGDFICHWCSAGFTTQGELTHHLRSHQPYLSRQHVCQHCQKRFQYRKDLQRHLPKHDPNRKKYYCFYKGCKYHSRGFGRQDHLDRHIQTQHRVDTPQQSSSRPSSNHA